VLQFFWLFSAFRIDEKLFEISFSTLNTVLLQFIDVKLHSNEFKFLSKFSFRPHISKRSIHFSIMYFMHNVELYVNFIR
jgi:hypothetical protein